MHNVQIWMIDEFSSISTYHFMTQFWDFTFLNSTVSKLCDAM